MVEVVATNIQPNLDVYTWTGFSTADAPDAIELNAGQGVMMTGVVFGTIGGGTVVWQGSIDGTNYGDLGDITTTAISITDLTDPVISEISTRVRFIRPRTSGGTSDSLTAQLMVQSIT